MDASRPAHPVRVAVAPGAQRVDTRREFLRKASAAAVGAAVAPDLLGGQTPVAPTPGDGPGKDLLMAALQAARDAGASYGDARLGRYRRQMIATRERQVTDVTDAESYGLGVRVLVNGSWGFAATRDLTRPAVQALAQDAVRTARAATPVQKRAVVLAPVAPVVGTWQTPVAVDPSEVPVEEKIALLLKTNEAALGVKGVRFVNSSLAVLREEKTLATTDGTFTVQTFHRVGPQFTATAIASGDFQTYSHEIAPRGAGWEYVTGLDMAGHAPEWAAIAVEKLSAPSVTPGSWDLILDPTNLWLTIHESIGHPTELDRAMGYEANYAGTSFIAPPDRHIGKLRYGRDLMNVRADRTQAQSLARCAWDDEGVPADEWLLVEKGLFKDYQTTREQAAWIAKLTGVTRSHGCAFADSWGSVTFQRMPNVSLLPGDQDIGLDEIVAATERGILIRNRGSWSIDHQRYNFQFSGQVFHEVRGGKITRMLKDVAYQARTPEFWNSMDMIGGARSYWLGGSFGDGKGEPGQSNSVSHGCPPARFRGVTIVNTGRQS
jgi:TldD protein